MYNDEDLEDELVYSSAQEYSYAFPQEKFMVSYILKVDSDLGYQRINHMSDNVADVGKMVKELQSKGMDTVEVFRLEPYSIGKALSVYEKKEKRALRRASKKSQ